jgi:hypothetical protein
MMEAAITMSIVDPATVPENRCVRALRFGMPGDGCASFVELVSRRIGRRLLDR